MIEGAQNIFFAQLADPDTGKFAVSATRFMSGKFPLMIFGLPGAALAMYQVAKPEKKKLVGGLLLSAALTAMLTGITEPIEFTFLFVAPLLYGIHCVFAGLAYMLMHVFHVGVGMTFSGGLIDMFLFGVLQGNEKTNWVWIVIVGIGYFILYYFLFRFLIVKLNLKTPGRDDSDEVKLYRRSDVEERKAAGAKGAEEEMSRQIVAGLGGKKNISDVDCCATRLRCTVYQSDLERDDVLKQTGASGVVHKGDGVQVIYGPRVTVIKSNLEDYLETAPEEAEEIGSGEAKPRQEPSVAGKSHNKGSKKNGEKEAGRGKNNRHPRRMIIHSPIKGKAAPLSTTPDEAFAKGLMGDGVTITPEGDLVRAPEDGRIIVMFDTKHALGFQTDEGIEMLIHVGIDTVKLGGRGFEALVDTGQRVKKGEPLMRLDLDYLRKHAPSMASPVLCTNLEESAKVRLLKEGTVQAGEELMEIEW